MDKKEAVKGMAAVWAYLSSNKIALSEKIVITGLVLAYIISPFDLIPDIPVIGWLDDIGVGALFLAFCNYRVKQLESSTPADDQVIIDVSPEAQPDTPELKKISHKDKESFFFSTDGKKK